MEQSANDHLEKSKQQHRQRQQHDTEQQPAIEAEQRPVILHNEPLELVSAEQLLEQQRFAQAALAIERQIMDGKRITLLVLLRLPQRYRSSIIMQELVYSLMHAGDLLEAQKHAQLAVKGFAASYMPQPLLASLALLGQLYFRTGNYDAAYTIIEQLRAEYRQAQELPLEVQAAIAHCLAISGTLWPLQQQTHTREQLFQAAIASYEQQQRWYDACLVTVELAVHAGQELQPEDWQQLQQRCAIWFTRERQLMPFAQVLKLIHGYCNKQWSAVLDIANEQEQTIELPYWIAAHIANIALCSAYQLEQMMPQRDSAFTIEQITVMKQKYEQAVRACSAAYPDDLLLQYELKSSLRACCSLTDVAAAELDIQLRSLADMLSDRPARLHLTIATAAASTHAPSEQPRKESGWKLYLFGSLRFARDQEEHRQLPWKRKKARELLLYLALQPYYMAAREQIIDVLQLGDSLDKAAQQLYVIVHQLKRTLLTELGIEQAVIVKDSLLRLREEAIEYVDVEHYLTLIRVADQLWQFDRGLSYEMYEQAYLLYDHLLPELPYVEWLEQHREYIAQKQISLLQKCLQHAEERQDWQHVEIYLRSWLALKPFQEEAHAKLVSLLIQLGRRSEAKQAYAGWTNSCREELGTIPSFTPMF